MNNFNLLNSDEDNQTRKVMLAPSASNFMFQVGDGPSALFDKAQAPLETVFVGKAISKLPIVVKANENEFIFTECADGSLSSTAMIFRPSLLPQYPKATLILTRLNIEVIYDLMSEFFEKKKPFLCSRYVGSECAWRCSYLQGYCSINFGTRIYRLGNSSESFGVEFSRLDGDRTVFYEIYNECNALLDNSFVHKATETVDNVPTLDFPTDCGLDDSLKTYALSQIQAPGMLFSGVDVVSRLYDAQLGSSLEPPSSLDSLILSALVTAVEESSELDSEATRLTALQVIANILTIFPTAKPSVTASAGFVGLVRSVAHSYEDVYGADGSPAMFRRVCKEIETILA